MTKRVLILEDRFDLAEMAEKLRVGMYAPVREDDGTWACWIELSEPLEWAGNAYGATALQALALGLKMAATHLYGVPLWREGKIGLDGEFGGYLGLPAPTQYLHFAPFPF